MQLCWSLPRCMHPFTGGLVQLGLAESAIRYADMLSSAAAALHRGHHLLATTACGCCCSPPGADPAVSILLLLLPLPLPNNSSLPVLMRSPLILRGFKLGCAHCRWEFGRASGVERPINRRAAPAHAQQQRWMSAIQQPRLFGLWRGAASPRAPT